MRRKLPGPQQIPHLLAGNALLKAPRRPCNAFNSESGSRRAARQKYHPGVEHYPPGRLPGKRLNGGGSDAKGVEHPRPLDLAAAGAVVSRPVMPLGPRGRGGALVTKRVEGPPGPSAAESSRLPASQDYSKVPRTASSACPTRLSFVTSDRCSRRSHPMVLAGLRCTRFARWVNPSPLGRI